MLNFSKSEILKTVLIVWLIGATAYVGYDLYAGYKIRGIQASYQNGYTAAVDDLIKKTQSGGCQPFEIQKGETKVQVVDGQCLQQAQANQQPVSQPQSTPQKNK